METTILYNTMDEIKYIGFYSNKNSSKKVRCGALSAENKMNYIADSIIDLGYSIKMISPSWLLSENNKSTFENGYLEKVDKDHSLLYSFHHNSN